MWEHWTLKVLGCRGSWPVSGREFMGFGGGTSAYLLRRWDYAILIDCGSGLSAGKRDLEGCSRVDVVLTHLHYDHLIGLLNWDVFPRGARIRFFSRFDCWFGEESLRRFLSSPFWPYTPQMGKLETVTVGERVELEYGVSALFYPSNHPNDACIIRLDTPEGSMCAAFDYEHSRPFPLELGRGCALLLYDAMYTPREYTTRKGYGHSCWQEGVALAGEIGVGQLVLTHHSPERNDRSLRRLEKQAQAVMPGARFARSGDMYIFANGRVATEQ